jgi:hypothetical protein
MRNLAPAADNADNISTRSRFIDEPLLEHPGLQRELPHHGDARTRRQAPHVIGSAFFGEGNPPDRKVAWHGVVIVPEGTGRRPVPSSIAARAAAPAVRR